VPVFLALLLLVFAQKLGLDQVDAPPAAEARLRAAYGVAQA
jgi:hypothetical protein